MVGAGPAGLTVANLLQRSGIDCVVLEEQSRDFITHRPRAGHIEDWAVHGLIERGLGNKRIANAPRLGTFEIRSAGSRHPVNYSALSGRSHVVYPQHHLVTDLLDQYVADGGEVIFDVQDVQLHDLESASPVITFTTAAGDQRIVGDFVAGCDGAQGACRGQLPAAATVVRHDYGVRWLALLAQAPPSSDGVLFGIHPSGFAAHMARTPEVTRFYLQLSADDTEADWSDERVWHELHERLAVPGGPLRAGTLLEKRALDLHSYVVEPMTYGRLHLAGDAAHLVAPIAAKGMNLALHDAFVLAEALTAHYAGDDSLLAGYSAACLPLVWKYQEFSVWLSEIFHRTPSSRDTATGDDLFLARTAAARMQHLLDSPAAATAFAETYIGRPLDRKDDGTGNVSDVI